jgi:uncharacterized protein (DUF1015 family)
MGNDVFQEAAGPSYFVYRLAVGERSQTGLVCGVAVDDYDRGVVRIHEQVKPDRADHLAKHLGVVGAQSSPIALACHDSVDFSDALDKVVAGHPELDFVTRDGLHQQIWKVVGVELTKRFTTALSELPLYLIDGHHRAAAAASHRRGDNGKSPGADWMLAAVFSASEMHNKAFHRIVAVDSYDELLTRMGEHFSLRRAAAAADVVSRSNLELAMGCRSETGRIDWYLIELPTEHLDRIQSPPGPLTVVDGLDQSRLASHILGPIFQIDEADPQGRLRYQPGLSDEPAIEEMTIKQGEAVFIMRPVGMDELFEASDEGLVMPPKSTYFEPKVRSGLFVHFKDRI